MPGQIWFIPMVPTQLLTALHPQKCSQLVGKVLWSSYWLEVIGPKIQIRRKPDSCPERVHENGRGTQENGWLQYKSKGDICYNIRMSIHTQKSWHVNRVLEDEWEWSTLDTKGQVMLERGQHPKWSDREEPLCHYEDVTAVMCVCVCARACAHACMCAQRMINIEVSYWKFFSQ